MLEGMALGDMRSGSKLPALPPPSCVISDKLLIFPELQLLNHPVREAAAQVFASSSLSLKVSKDYGKSNRFVQNEVI